MVTDSCQTDLLEPSLDTCNAAGHGSVKSGSLEGEVIDSPAALQCISGRWRRLLGQSYSTLATADAVCLAQWYEQFCAGQRFRAIVVHREGRLVGALPLVENRVGRIVRTGALPNNEWASCGDLLIDREESVNEIADQVVATMRSTPWKAFWLDEIEGQRCDWQAFDKALRSAHYQSEYHQRYEVGRFLIDHEIDFNEIRKGWPKNHRRNIDKGFRQLREHGELHLSWHHPQSLDEVFALCQEAFDIEDRSWKGAEGTSILKSEGMERFLKLQAAQLFHTNALRFMFLELDGVKIAFEFGWITGERFHSYKVSYDPTYAKFSPGQLLVYLSMQHFHSQRRVSEIDCLGPMTQAMSRWRPQTYSVGRLVAGRGLRGSAFARLYNQIWRPLRSH